MSTNRAAARGFGPYSMERTLAPAEIGDVAYCARCRKLGRKTVLVQKCNAIGQVRDRCPICDGVSKPRARSQADEVFRPQALISPAQLLPPCPAGMLRCQACARPVIGDARLCPRCELPGLEAAAWESGLISVAATLRAARKAIGLTQTEVGKRAGVSGSAVAQLETEGYDRHSLGPLRRIAAAMGCVVTVKFSRYAGDGEAES